MYRKFALSQLAVLTALNSVLEAQNALAHAVAGGANHVPNHVNAGKASITVGIKFVNEFIAAIEAQEAAIDEEIAKELDEENPAPSVTKTDEAGQGSSDPDDVAKAAANMTSEGGIDNPDNAG